MDTFLLFFKWYCWIGFAAGAAVLIHGYYRYFKFLIKWRRQQTISVNDKDDALIILKWIVAIAISLPVVNLIILLDSGLIWSKERRKQRQKK